MPGFQESIESNPDKILGVLIKAKHKTDIPKLFEASSQIIAYLNKNSKLKPKVLFLWLSFLSKNRSKTLKNILNKKSLIFKMASFVNYFSNLNTKIYILYCKEIKMTEIFNFCFTNNYTQNANISFIK